MLLVALGISGCAAKTGNQFLETTSSEELSKKLIKHHTTKNNVKQMFGDPMHIEIVRSNIERWTYEFVRSEAKMSNFVPLIDIFYKGSNDNRRALHITFNPDNIVLDFYLINSNSETKMGLFQ